MIERVLDWKSLGLEECRIGRVQDYYLASRSFFICRQAQIIRSADNLPTILCLHKDLMNEDYQTNYAEPLCYAL